MSRRTAHDVLKDAFETAGLNGKLATHSLRKSFAQRLYDQTGDIFTVQEMLGHKSVVTTQKYLGVNYASVRDALQKMSLDAELHEIGILGSSLKKEADATLFLELALRGYDLSKLRENNTTGEIVKIFPITCPPVRSSAIYRTFPNPANSKILIQTIPTDNYLLLCLQFTPQHRRFTSRTHIPFQADTTRQRLTIPIKRYIFNLVVVYDIRLSSCIRRTYRTAFHWSCPRQESSSR